MQTANTTHDQAAGDREAQTIRYWMSAAAITVTSDAQASEALALMHEHAIRRLPVVTAAGDLCGITTDGDIRGAEILHATGLDMGRIASALRRTTVYEVMTERPITVSPMISLREAALLMLDNKIGGLPVVDAGDTLVGIITESGLFEALVCYLD